MEEGFVRLHATYVGRIGVEVGLFVAVDHLRRADLLTLDEEEQYFDVDDWFQENLPNPPFYEDGNSVGGVTWFKLGTAQDLVARLAILGEILDRHGVGHLKSYSNDPGTVIYEDEFQVGVIPYERREPVPVPHGLPMNPSLPGSKRHLGKRAAGLTS